MKDFFKVSPLTILEGSTCKELGRGNLGVLMASAGLGKTSCLINIAFDKLFHGEKLVHISLKDMPGKVTSYYNVILSDLVKVLEIQDEHEVRALIDKNRIILAYLKESFDLTRLQGNLNNLVKEIDFAPDTLIVDGLDFAETGREFFEGLRRMAQEFQAEVWLAALTHRHITEVNEKGIPYPCNNLDDLFSIIIQLSSSPSGVFLELLKEHDREGISDAVLRLDPNNFLAME